MLVPEQRPSREERAKSLRELLPAALRFLGTGLVSFPLGLGVSALAHELIGWREEIAVACALAVLLVFNFIVSRRYVFRSSGSSRAQMPRFVAVALVMRGVEYLLFLALFRRVPYLPAMAVAMTLSLAVKFCLYRWWVFRPVERAS